MRNLADLLNLVVSTLQTSQLCNAVRVLDISQFSDYQFALKVRADLTSGASLRVRLYRNGDHVDYAYHLNVGQKSARWDNKEHFVSLPSYPHHFHSLTGQVEASPLRGDPDIDLLTVLDAIGRMIG